MPGEENITVEGVVMELLAQNLFRVGLSNGHMLFAHLSGRMRLNLVRLVVGDRVKIEVSPFDLTKGSIVFKQET